MFKKGDAQEIMINLNQFDLGNSPKKYEHIIYYEWYTDIRAGGPTGYLANLLDGLNRIENNENPIIFFNILDKMPPTPLPEIKGIYKNVHDFFYNRACLKSFYIDHVSRYQKRLRTEYLNFLKSPNAMYCRDDMFGKMDLKQTKTIHVHTIGDAIKVRNSLNRIGAKRTKLLLTSHTPEAPSDEYYKDYLENGHEKKYADEVKKLWIEIEKRAFKAADILIFPSKEAMEPLYSTMEDFQELVKNKDIRFIPSGAKQLTSLLSKEEAKKKYGVEGKFVVGYVGRHNEVKGYDILQNAAQKVLMKDKNITFLIGGKQGNVFAPLNDERWIEAGWVNPADLFQAIDVFVLPNRMTYFDLVLLEVMSMGVPIIASATGGNKSVQQQTEALILYDNSADGLAESILTLSQATAEELENYSKRIRQEYEKNYTPSIFATHYISLINQIYADYSLL